MYRTVAFCLIIVFVLNACSPSVSTPSLIPTDPNSATAPEKMIGTKTPLPTKIPNLESPVTPTLIPSHTLGLITPSPLVTTPVNTTPVVSTTESAESISEAIIIDHTSVELFERIPEQYLTAARDLHMVYSDRSVGQNINESLDCLTATSWSTSMSGCRVDYYGRDGSTWLFKTFTQADYQNNLVPARILFSPSPTQYNRSNWVFDARMGEWESLIAQFVEEVVPAHINNKDVLSFQFSYLNVLDGSTIDDPTEGFFSDQPHDGYYVNRERWDISDLEELEDRYPEKTFFYWTTSLARNVGSPDATNFNNQMRQYVIANNKILFDVADIESYDDRGNPCYDNRDGVEFCGKQGCENYSNDQLDYPAICQDYTTEIDGGHLGTVSAGRIRLAKAYWVLMARIAGWDGK